ncbi:hypothetical protein SIAM614_31646 [Stappia aggregata IAM 12614]|uniref:Uncharacterized protein n=1 Tax=Roseibium aggregatum (strain ATCC 25650 / DSM 13394 / JCM 20685 / NBRC 16684 / NCIMB 2208 / IAM 12614 / B1) TaxID=384765 RepID=A0P4E1_ROSAI|nr:hypothetical protein SIAM614_31646 [Stappia aggregata IAM 12614] [Roseibium aggregatum IAM 12614]
MFVVLQKLGQSPSCKKCITAFLSCALLKGLAGQKTAGATAECPALGVAKLVEGRAVT